MSIELLRQAAARSMPFDVVEGDAHFDTVLLLRAAGLVAALSLRVPVPGMPLPSAWVLRVLAITPRGRRAMACGIDEPETFGLLDVVPAPPKA
jgi:hypothetical protein